MVIIFNSRISVAWWSLHPTGQRTRTSEPEHRHRSQRSGIPIHLGPRSHHAKWSASRSAASISPLDSASCRTQGPTIGFSLLDPHSPLIGHKHLENLATMTGFRSGRVGCVILVSFGAGERGWMMTSWRSCTRWSGLWYDRTLLISSYLWCSMLMDNCLSFSRGVWVVRLRINRQGSPESRSELRRRSMMYTICELSSRSTLSFRKRCSRYLRYQPRFLPLYPPFLQPDVYLSTLITL